MMARNRWLKALVEETGADPGQLSSANMGDIMPGYKGGLELCLGKEYYPMTPRLMQELGIWRSLLGLPEQIGIEEHHPLIQVSLRRPDRISRAALRIIAGRLVHSD